MASHTPPVAGSARLWRWLTEPDPSVVDPPQRSRAQLLAALLIGLIMLSAGYGLWYLTQVHPVSGVWSEAKFLITTAGVAILCVAYWLSRGPHWRTAAMTLVVISNLLMLVVILVAPKSPLDTAWLLVSLLVCSLLLSARASVVLLASLCAITFVLPRFVGTPSWFGGRGAELFLVTGGLMVVVVAIVRDHDIKRLAQQARALAERETALRASEERYRSLVTELNDGIYACDARGVITYANPALARMLGLEHPAQAVGQQLTKFVAPNMVDEVVEALRRDVEEARSRDAMTVKILRPHEANATVEVSAGAVMDGDRVVGMRGILHDVTARERAEHEIRRLNAELQERVVSRTEQRDAATRELEAFAYSVAHDVRTPLRAIDGFAAMVIEDNGTALDGASLEHLGRAREAAQRMARLLDDVLGLSRVSVRDLNRKPVDLSRLATDVGAELRAEQPQRVVELTVEVGLTADADPALTRLILRELLANAWKFTRRRDVAHVEVGALDAEGEQAFYVRDDGAGFDMRHAGHLFGAFQRMHAADEFAGDGIGLATVQRIVRRHGGHVRAEAEVDKGATFYFTLPGADASG